MCYDVRMSRTLIEFTCPECGGIGRLAPSVMARGPVHYCSIGCATAARNRSRTGPQLHRRKRVIATCCMCSKEYETYPSWLKKTANPCCSNACRGSLARANQSGPKSPRWRGGTSINAKGYVIHHRPDGRHRVEHRLVLEAAMGRALASTEIVHHRNHVKVDNRPDNLTIMTNSAHMRLHMAARGGPPGLACIGGCGRRTRRGRDGRHYQMCALCRLDKGNHDGRHLLLHP